MREIPKSVHQTIIAMADHARVNHRPLPVIETDYETAKILCDAICDSMYCQRADLKHAMDWPHMMEFDGVKIVVRKIKPEELYATTEELRYREHFGALADIWSDVENIGNL